LASSCAATCLAGLALHVTVGDECEFPWYAVYYALPRPVLCGLTVIAAIAWPRQRRMMKRASWLAAGLLAAWVLAADVGWKSPPMAPAEESHRVAFWNAAGRRRGWEPASREVEALQADIIGVVECGYGRPADKAYWAKRFPDYCVELPRPGMAFLVRGTIHDRGHAMLGVRSDARWWDVEVGGRECRVVLVDISSDLWQPRPRLLDRLQKLIRATGDRPVLVMGDFNTPADAPSLSRLRAAGLRLAADERGRGYRCTWPAPVPVLTLDQIWVNGDVAVMCAEAGWSWQSDHRPVSAVVTFAATVADARRASTTAGN
jgi:hypothetical protein